MKEREALENRALYSQAWQNSNGTEHTGGASENWHEKEGEAWEIQKDDHQTEKNRKARL